MRKVLTLTLTTAIFALFLAGCAEEEPQGDTGVAGGSATQADPESPGATTVSGSTTSTTTISTTGATTAGAVTATTAGGTTVTGTTGSTTGGTTVSETTSSPGAAQALGEATTMETTRQLSGEEVAVGGFAVEDPGFPEFTVPEATVRQEALDEYLGKIRPIVEGSTRDVSGLLGPEAGVQDGDLTLSISADTLENARGDVQNGLDQLRGVQAPQNLQPIDEQLVSSYQRGLSAYNNMIDAVESGESQRVNDAVQNSLPRIERFDAETAAIVQSLQRGAGS